MAIYYARATGNVNGTIWATTPTGTASNLFSSFTNADTLMANNFTVTLNVNTTVLEIKNDNSNGATAGGGFTINNGVTLTANVVGGTVNAFLLQIANAATCSIVGSISGTNTSFSAMTCQNSFGTLTITGNITGGTTTADAFSVGSPSGTVIITGNVSGGSVGASFAAVSNTSAASITITGTVTGGNVQPTGYGARNVSNGTLTINGTAVGGAQGPGVFSSSTGVVTVTRAKGNGFGNGSTGLLAAVGVSASQTAPIRVSEIEYGDLGQSPTAGPIILTDSTSNVALLYRTSGGKKTLVDSAAAANYPANSNVRSGIVFANGNRTGTMVVPASSSVAAGVSVDNTVGTAVLTASTVQTSCDSALSSFSSGRLSNCSTISSTGQQLANILTG